MAELTAAALDRVLLGAGPYVECSRRPAKLDELVRCLLRWAINLRGRSAYANVYTLALAPIASRGGARVMRSGSGCWLSSSLLQSDMLHLYEVAYSSD